MKLVRWLRLTTLTTLGLSLGLGSGWQEAIATTFANADVDQSRFVLLASSGSSRLTILEQISNARSCWNAQGTEVEPLLLNFDFTGICGRSSDLNGYSVRINNEDLGMRYRLQIANRGDAMVLYAVPRSGGTSLEVGRTRGIPQEFGAIELSPGWRITRRMFNGQALGHIYLTNEQTLPTLIAANASGNSGSTLVAQTPAPQPSPTSNSSSSSSSGSLPRASWRDRPASTPASSTTSSIDIPVPQPDVRSSSSISGSPVPPPPSRGVSSGEVAVVPVPGLPPAPTGHRPPGDSMIPVVPVTQDIWFSQPPTFQGTPQPASNLASNLGYNYRLIVSDSSPDTQRRIRSIVPDAFRTVVNGQVVMQAGLFYSPSEADDLMRRLNQQNLTATLIAVE